MFTLSLPRKQSATIFLFFNAKIKPCKGQYINGNIFFFLPLDILQVSKSPAAHNPGLMAWTTTMAAAEAVSIIQLVLHKS